MNPSNHDPDDLVRKKVDLNHITKMSYHMHVPDSITVGPDRSTMARINHDNNRVPFSMEVPHTIRLSNHANTNISNGNNISNHSSDMTLPTTDDDEGEGDDDVYTPIGTTNNRQPIKLADSWHVEPSGGLNDKNTLIKLQNRIDRIERTLARRDFRDRLIYTCVIGYFFIQAILSVRRSMVN